jgi:hypothetical protein
MSRLGNTGKGIGWMECREIRARMIRSRHMAE